MYTYRIVDDEDVVLEYFISYGEVMQAAANSRTDLRVEWRFHDGCDSRWIEIARFSEGREVE
jgi:hypothetical protein